MHPKTRAPRANFCKFRLSQHLFERFYLYKNFFAYIMLKGGAPDAFRSIHLWETIGDINT